MASEYCRRYAAAALQLFDEQCMEVAKNNWCPSQVKMLRRLFDAVSTGTEYDKVPDHDVIAAADIMQQCKRCDNLDNDRNGFYCMVIDPKIEDGVCKSFDPKAEKWV